MSKFFSLAGDYLGYETRVEGSFPRSTHVVRFSYSNGWSEFDGRGWTYHIDAA